MELRHLRYFVAVCEALNFTRAAAQLRIAQPALSRQVQDLEDEIGVDLLKRSPRGVTITAEGKLFLEEAREALKRADDEVETGRVVALASPVFKHVSGKRLLYRPLAGINDVVSVGIARAKNGDLTPAGEKFCESLRK